MEILTSLLPGAFIGAAVWVLHGPSAGVPAVLLGVLSGIIAHVLFD